MKKYIRFIIAVLTASMLLPFAVACSKTGEIPDGFQDATCDGEYFRLFIPTQWNVNTESGVSSGYVSGTAESGTTVYATVSLTEGVSAEAYLKQADELSDAAETEVEETSVNLPKATDLYWNDLKSEYETELSGFRLETEGVKKTLGGRSAREYTYLFEKTAFADGASSVSVYKIRQLISEYKGLFFIFTYSAETTIYDTYDAEVDNIIDNVTFLNVRFTAENTRAAVEDEDAPDGMVRISDDRVAYKFFAPKEWKIDTSVGQSNVYFSEDDKSNVSAVAYMPATDTVTLAAYVETCKNEYEATFNGYALISETGVGELTIDERPAVRLVYTASLGGVDYKLDQTVISYGSMFYIITYTAKTENFDLHTADVQKMIDAFKFR